MGWLRKAGYRKPYKIGDQAFCAPDTWLRFVVCAGGRFAIRIRQVELFSGTGLSAAIRAGNAGR
jgi:hypothetical protein